MPSTRKWLLVLMGSFCLFLGVYINSRLVVSPTKNSALPNIKTRVETHNVTQVFVPAGCFMMGSNPNQDNMAMADELPQHKVCITHDFWLDQNEVTNKEFQKFVDAHGYSTRKYWTAEGWEWLQNNKITGPKIYVPEFSQPDQPRIGINWYEASAYATWRGGQLPSEAEYEYAARGPNSLIYSWGNTWAEANEKPEITKSWIGAYNLSCNVLEWTSDWYSSNYYSNSPQNDPFGPSSGEVHILRGGTWDEVPGCTRGATRKGGFPDDRGLYQGVRIIIPILEF